MLRSGVGVVGGYVVFAVSAALLFVVTGRDPHATQDTFFEVSTTVYGMVFAGIGGYLAARIAGRRTVLHAGIVAALIAVGAAVSLLASPKGDAIWSQLTALTLMAPCAVAGGWLRKTGPFLG